MATNYDRGRAHEYRTRDLLLADGYEVVRAAGSKGPADLMAFKPGQTLAVNVKRDRLSATEWDAFYRLCLRLGWVPLLALPGPRGTPVQLWRITGPKVPRARADRQSLVPFALDEIAAAVTEVTG
jgi:hypothetical protein